MERRKVQKVGGSTYTVSVPKDWAHEHHIEAGEDVHLYTHADGSLVVRSSTTDGEALASRTVALADGPAEDAEELFRGLYAAGFDEFTFESTSSFDDAQRRRITSVARDTVGMQVVSAGEHEITVRSLLDAADVSVQQSVLQLQFIALSIHRTAVDSLAADSAPADVRDRAEEVHRLAGMVVRHFTRSLSDFEETDALGIDRQTLFTLCRVARAHERLADDAVTIADVAASVDRPLPAEYADGFGSTATAARSLLEDATELVLEGGDVDDVTALLDRHRRIVADVERAESGLLAADADADPRLLRALDTVTRTADSGRAVARRALGTAGDGSTTGGGTGTNGAADGESAG